MDEHLLADRRLGGVRDSLCCFVTLVLQFQQEVGTGGVYFTNMTMLPFCCSHRLSGAFFLPDKTMGEGSMAMTTALMVALMAQAPTTIVVQPAPEFEVGYVELLAGDDSRAIERIEANASLPNDDPALLINKGVALARLGHIDEARESFEAAARGRHQMDLETTSGEWVDARSIARRALVMLDGGTLARDYALLMH